MELTEKLRNSDYPKFIKLLESGNYCFACISACHGVFIPERLTGELTPEELKEKNKIIQDNLYNNKKNTEDLRINILSNTFSFFFVEGRYIEEQAGPIIEKSFLLYTKKENREKLFNFSIDMCRRYRQDSIMFIESDKLAACYNQFGEICQKYKLTDNYIFNNADLSQYATHFGSRIQNRSFSIDFFKENLENLNLMNLFYKKIKEKNQK